MFNVIQANVKQCFYVKLFYTLFFGFSSESYFQWQSQYDTNWFRNNNDYGGDDDDGGCMHAYRHSKADGMNE